MEAGRTQELLPFWLEFSIIKCCLEDEGHSHLATITMVGERAAVGSLPGMLIGRIRDCGKICTFVAVCMGPGTRGIQPLTWLRCTNSSSLGSEMDPGETPP